MKNLGRNKKLREGIPTPVLIIPWGRVLNRHKMNPLFDKVSPVAQFQKINVPNERWSGKSYQVDVLRCWLPIPSLRDPLERPVSF